MPSPANTTAAAPPLSFRRFSERYPSIVETYERYGEALREAGPLSEREIALVKLAASVGARMEGAACAQARKAAAAGVGAADIEHVVLLTASTVGFASMMEALGWVRDASKSRNDDLNTDS